MISVYIHIPFCNNICSYCDFSKVYYNEDYVDKYLNSLKKEIKKRYNNKIVKTLYIGGGTPSALSVSELVKLFDILKIFNLSNEVEFTMEANPDSLTLEKIDLMKANKVNRVSLGVQSFDKDNLIYLNRTHSKEDVFNCINLLKSNGITNINIDLIYGIDEDLSKLKKDIDCFLSLDIPHISTYSLIIEKNTVLNNKKVQYIDQDLDYEMYKYIETALENNGYIHYEISNYAKEGYYSKHNLVYWNNLDYYGFGLSSVSYIDNYRITNTKNLTKYLANDYLFRKEYEDQETKMYNEIMLKLRTNKGIDLKLFKENYNVCLSENASVIALVKDNYLIKENDFLKINKQYLYISNEIILRIDLSI